MADESSDQSGTVVSEQDPVKNAKAEFDRKLQAINDQIAAQNQFYAEQFTSLQNAIKSTKAVEQSPQEDKALEQLAYNEPAKYAKVVQERATSAATEAATRIAQAQSERQNFLVQMVAEYPELNDPSSDLYQKVINETKTLSSSDAANNRVLKGVIAATAADMGVLPKSRRTAGNDNFTLGGSRSGGASNSSARSKQEKLPSETLAFAEAIGMKINDPKYIERLEKASRRKNWSKYE